jgi:hypothetical protein
MSVITLDIAVFRAQFPAFSNVTTYPDLTVQMYFDMSTNYVSDENAGYLRDSSRTLALYLMTAHLLAIATATNSGKPIQAIVSASEGSVSVSLAAPPVKSGWQWWLSSTPYGAQLWSLLSVKAVGGFYIGGALNRSGIRKPNGAF